MKFQKIQLDHQAIDYIKTILKEMKEEHIINSINFSKGQVCTYLPLNIKREAINKFEQGGFLPEPDERIHVEGGYFIKVPTDIYIYLAKEIVKYFQHNNSICFYRTNWGKKNDPFLKNLKKPKIFFHNEWVYRLINKTNNPELLKKEINFDSRYSFGLMTKKNLEMKFLQQDRKDCSDEDMQYFIDHIQKLFVVAYDGEGFIIWEKNN